MRGQRLPASQLGLMLLAAQLFQVGLDNVPTVTLGVLGFNVYLYLFPAAPLLQACMNVQEVYWRGDWQRLFLSPFHHVDDWHLYFNLTSFLWKGINLERQMGGAWFLYVLSVFSLLTGLVYLGLEAGLTLLTDDHSYSVQCAVGFSGVLFALKILNNHYHPGGVTHVLGLAVDNRYASWVELVLIHLTNPGSSLIAHLAGILVGLLYTNGPLKSMMKNCAALVTGPSRYTRPNYFYLGSGTRLGGRAEGEYAARWRDHAGGMTEQEQLNQALRNSMNDTGYSGTRSGGPAGEGYAAHWRDNAGGMTEQEQLDQALRNSMNDTEPRPGDGAPPPYGFHLSDEEVRRRRLRRFDL